MRNKGIGLGASALALTLLLSACSSESDYSQASPSPAPQSTMAYGGDRAEADTQMERLQKQSSPPAPPPASGQPASDNPAVQSFLAYTYSYGFALPAKAVADTAKSHAQICLDAGPAKCQLLGSNTNFSSKVIR